MHGFGLAFKVTDTPQKGDVQITQVRGALLEQLLLRSAS